jgi:hypothetical protein
VERPAIGARAAGAASLDGDASLGRVPPCPADDIASSVFAGRVAIWGVVVPLAALVVAWGAILVRGDEDAALAFGARWGTVFAWWLGGIVAALVVCRIVLHVLLARRRRAWLEVFHRLLTEERGRRSAHDSTEPRPALTLLEVIVAIFTALVILSVAAPAAGSPGEADFFLCGPPTVVIGIASILTSVALLRGAEHAQACRKRFDKWKARRASRREARTAAGAEEAR